MTYTAPEPDAFESAMFQIEKILAALEQAQRQLARVSLDDLARDIDEWDDEGQRQLQRLRAVDHACLFDDARSFLLIMHDIYRAARDRCIK